MGLSRLDQFLKSTRGTILHVNNSSLDATDSIENTGSSPVRPFFSLQRALIEASRYSYQSGEKNDRFNRTTILVAPGEYLIDNRPGWIPFDDSGTTRYKVRDGNPGGSISNDFGNWSLSSNFDLTNSDNELYKLNSIFGGVIIPRGTSIVAQDLRKTKFRPLYVPDPEDSDIERTALLRVTGGCYLWQFSIFDADPNGFCYKNYSVNKFTPNFSHHKLTAFEYADGINSVNINDYYLNYSTTRTDLDLYYEKIALIYGDNFGDREIPDPIYSNNPVVDIQPVIDEYRIVGPSGQEVGISSVTSSGTTVTVTTQDSLEDISVDSPIIINGVDGTYGFGVVSGFDGQSTIYRVLGNTVFEYQVGSAPVTPQSVVFPPSATLSLAVDTVNSSSPYIFNVSLRSVYGMNGLLADGDKASGFKSMVIAQFTGIGLQKDDNAFVKYNDTTGIYQYSNSIPNLHTNSRAVFRPEYENYHIKAVNNAFLQLVSVFAIGYANHFIVESGGDNSITNSNSNFGAKAFVSKGFRHEAFEKDDSGYITHIIPPQEIESEEIIVNFSSIDVGITTSVGISSYLYLRNENNVDSPPTNVIDGFRIGTKENDTLFVKIAQSGITSEYSARIVMSNSQSSRRKVFDVAKLGLVNDINSSIINLTSSHTLQTGEKIRIISDSGSLPDGLENNQIYYAVGVGSTSIRLAQTLNNAINSNTITLNNRGGNLQVISQVSDKKSGDVGHPIQWDSINSNWYIQVESSNSIYNILSSSGVSGIGNATPRTFLKRIPDNRNIQNTIYKIRYVVSKDQANARPPLDGFILQESNGTVGSGTTDLSKYFSVGTESLDNSSQLRNIKLIASANWSANTANFITELPHNLRVGSKVEIYNVKSTNNTLGVGNSGYNGTFNVAGIDSSRHFSCSLLSNPGVFTNDTTIRDENLPAFKRKELNTTLQIYSSEEIQKYIKDKQDGIYHLIVTNSSISPEVSPFQSLSFSQPIQNLYPQLNRDNPISDPDSTKSFALPNPIGQVIVNDPEKSITRETLFKALNDFNVGFGITNIISNNAGTAHTIYTTINHEFAGITSASIVSSGSSYIPGTYYAANLVGFAGSTTGLEANARIVVNASGNVSAIKIMSGGTLYGIGNTLSVIPAAGIGTTTGFIPAVVQVTSVQNNLNDVISINGIGGTFTNYNTLYRVTGISSYREIQVASASTITSSTTSGIGSVRTRDALCNVTGKVLSVTSFTYNSTVGIATLNFIENHGLQVNNKIRIGGAESEYFNKHVIVKKVNSLSSIAVNIGKGGAGLSTGGTIFVYRNGYASNGGVVTRESENLGGRQVISYAGITTTISSTINSTTTTISIPNAVTLGLNIGDYLQINHEIVRIRESVISDSVVVFRALFGSTGETHVAGSVIRRIEVLPIELRRNSIIRASGHTFEYLGFGPGNYSTALPDKQDRKLTAQEEQISQVSRVNGGIINFTAMNSNGDFYTGNKKINSTTGQEVSYDSPVPNVSGEEKNEYGADVTKTSELYLNRLLKIDGGADKNLVSEFGGPVIFSKKITSTSDEGIEIKSLFIQGQEDVSRNFSIGTSIPLSSGNYGDIVTRSTPKLGDNVGWIYTLENQWKPFGLINDYTYGVGISTGNGPVGFSTLVNFTGVNIDVNRIYNSNTGITTLVFTASSNIAAYSDVAGIATYAGVAGIATFASTAGIATYATTAGIATYAGVAGITTYAGTAGIATYATTAGIATNSERIRIDSTNGNNSDSTTYVTLVADNTTGFQTSFIDSDFLYNASTKTLSASNFVGNLLGNALTANTATNATNAAYASSAGISTFAISAGYASTAGIATYAITAGIATYALNSGISTNVIGGIGSITSLRVSGITTLGIVTSGNIFSTGIITATQFRGGSFFGDGSGLTGITASGGGLVIRDNGVLVGTAGTVDFGDRLTVSSISAGVCTITASDSVSFAGYATTAGISTFATTAGIALTSTSVSLLNEASDSECFLTFSNDATGNRQLKTNSNLKYNSVSDILTVGTINGSVSVANQVKTQLAAPTTGYLTFVDSNNTTPNPENLYTYGSVLLQNANELIVPQIRTNRISSDDVSGAVRRQNAVNASGNSIILPISRLTNIFNLSQPAAGYDADYRLINKITINFYRLSTTLNDPIIIQFAEGGNFTTPNFVISGYEGFTSTNGIYLIPYAATTSSSSRFITGSVTVSYLNTGLYVINCNLFASDIGPFATTGSLIYTPSTPSFPDSVGRLSSVKLTSSNVSNTFDSGTISIMIEG